MRTALIAGGIPIATQLHRLGAGVEVRIKSYSICIMLHHLSSNFTAGGSNSCSTE